MEICPSGRRGRTANALYVKSTGGSNPPISADIQSTWISFGGVAELVRRQSAKLLVGEIPMRVQVPSSPRNLTPEGEAH